MTEKTPMMQQYWRFKEEYAGCILFFRLGDFYEMFYEDAVLVSRELEITLTGRGQGEERAPMCGVPYHAAEGYIRRLIERGHRVAICDQIGDPALSKGLVAREVTRVVTPGTVIEPGMLDEKKNNHILCVCLEGDGAGLAWADVSTGELSIEEFAHGAKDAISAEWVRIAPSETLCNPESANEGGTFSQSFALTQRPSEDFEDRQARRALEKRLSGKLSAYDCMDMRLAVRAAGALLIYLDQTQKREMTHVGALKVVRPDIYMRLDPQARRNLELTETIRGRARKGTLIHLLDKTATAMGARQLRSWVEQPLLDVLAIRERQDAVGDLLGDFPLCGVLAGQLRGVYDIERLAGRLTYGTITARECLSLLQSLERAPLIQVLIEHLPAPLLRQTAKELDPLEDVISLLRDAIAPEPPMKMGEGGVIRTGYSAELDSYRDAAENGQKWLLELEAREREETGIRNLKIGYNKVFNYYIEITKSNISQVPYRYQRKQTLANGERYVTEELKQIEERLLGAKEQALRLETELFAQVRERLLTQIARIQATARALKRVDALQSLAVAAREYDYVRPDVHEGFELTIEQGRHPVVERMLDEPFVPNDVHIDEQTRMLVLTGPNMAGKSTYMRQIALITLMAHIGSFVPARAARIPLTDQIFTRVGASDDLSSGQSTFMVEMREMSAILAHATKRSLVILDEIGRGTSTFDGLSIAWASVEYIADQNRLGAKTLFATHYHELTELEGALEGVANYFVDCREIGEDIVFLRQIKRGGADKSYGVQVASLAGLPRPLVSRAREIMAKLEVNDVSRQSITQSILVNPTGGEGQVNVLEFPAIELAQEIAALDVNAMTPMDAMNALYILREKAKKI